MVRSFSLVGKKVKSALKDSYFFPYYKKVKIAYPLEVLWGAYIRWRLDKKLSSFQQCLT